MSETYHDIPEETLNDVMLQVAEERERRDLIDADELRRWLQDKIDAPGQLISVRSNYSRVLLKMDDMQSEARR